MIDRNGRHIALFSIVLLSALWAIAFPILGQGRAPQIPHPILRIAGPFVSDPEVVRLLDCTEQNMGCNGSLNFIRLIEARLPRSERGMRQSQNPFTRSVTQKVLETVQSDLTDIRTVGEATEKQLSPLFLTDPGSRVELVGVVNRMDRQFVRDPVQRRCGEISVIYRFAYSLHDGAQASRLPVTMNLVFPAVPTSARVRTVTCAEVARRWVYWIDHGIRGSAEEVVHALVDPENGPLAFMNGTDIDRLELNMQAYRKGAQGDDSHFGTKAAYVMRVFKWNKAKKYFDIWFLRNQVDRTKIFCIAPNDPQCSLKTANHLKLVAFLRKPAVVAAIDTGTLEIPEDLHILAERAVSISPGGAHRSGNLPYWNAASESEQVITDKQIADALENARAHGVQLSFIKSVNDYRARLNDTSCTACHQTRAIAGFHFPGADRLETAAVNAVLLPGSPQFYGDQPRRIEILRKIAASGTKPLSEYALAPGYSARPLNRFAAALSNTQLIGGWGATCLIPEARQSSQRQWDCKSGYTCSQLFRSNEDPGAGTCVPAGQTEIGDALQRGAVETTSYGHDKYIRLAPVSPNGLIPPSALPANPPTSNSYYGAHQEFYQGEPNSADRVIRRDARTGGFPAGMLRLSECIGLPPEASCGLIASSGFNDCIKKIGHGGYTMTTCFEHFTSYAGVRACDAANPCRDDYICVRPMGYTPENAAQRYADRLARMTRSPYFKEVTGRDYDPKDFGQEKPDDAWVARNDQRGLCIPPYFVFQFRSDGHPAPDPQQARTRPPVQPARRHVGKIEKLS